MVERLIHEGKVAPIDFSSFSYYKNLNPAILAAAEVFDPQNQYSCLLYTSIIGKRLITDLCHLCLRRLCL